MKHTRKEMIDYLTQAREGTDPQHWEMYDDAMLAKLVTLTMSIEEDDVDDALATM
jgi:hypothetical protein